MSYEVCNSGNYNIICYYIIFSTLVPVSRKNDVHIGNISAFRNELSDQVIVAKNDHTCDWNKDIELQMWRKTPTT